MKKKSGIFFFTKYGNLSASTRERFNNFIPILKKKNIHVEQDNLIADRILKLKVFNNKQSFLNFFISILKRIIKIFFLKKRLLIIQYELITYFPPILELYLRIRGIPFIIDLDDIVYLNYNKNIFVNFFLKSKFKKIFSWSSGIIVGNRFLEKEIKKIVNTEVLYIPTTVDSNTKKIKKDKIFTVIWMGSPSTTKYIDDIRYAVEYLSIHEGIKFKIVGSKDSKIEKNQNIEFLNWTKKNENLYLSSSHLGIMPLRNNLWEKGKCGYKLLQYMSCSLPVIASPVGSNLDIVKKNKSGYFASDTGEWIKLILRYKNNIKLRKLHGDYGKIIVQKNFNIQKFSKDYIKLINKNLI